MKHHREHPNGTAFPYGFDGVTWGVKPPAFLREFTSGESWEIGVLVQEDKVWFVIR